MYSFAGHRPNLAACLTWPPATLGRQPHPATRQLGIIINNIYLIWHPHISIKVHSTYYYCFNMYGLELHHFLLTHSLSCILLHHAKYNTPDLKFQQCIPTSSNRRCQWTSIVRTPAMTAKHVSCFLCLSHTATEEFPQRISYFLPYCLGRSSPDADLLTNNTGGAIYTESCELA